MLTSHNLIVLSLDPDKRKGPGFPLFLLCNRDGERRKNQRLVGWNTLVHHVPSTSEPVASRMVECAFSGAQAMHSTTCSCSRNSALHSLEATTQTRTVWSFEQLAIKEPSWLGRTIRTHSLWPVNVFTQYLDMGHRPLQQLPHR